MKKQKRINILKITGAIAILLNIATIYINANRNININILCIFSIFINYLYIATPIKRTIKKGGKK